MVSIMNTPQTALADDKSAKFKTTLYLTESNRRRLDKLNRGNRTKLINQAIAEKLEEIEKENAKEKLLKSLKNRKTTPSNGVSTQGALREIRTKELHNLIENK